MTIEINTTVTCDNAPVEEVLRELHEKCPEVGQAQTSTVRLLMEDKDRLTRERDEWAKSANFIECEYNTKHDELVQARRETELERALKESLVAKNADLTYELGKANEEYKAAREEVSEWALKAANLRAELDKSRPALPDGMRIAEDEVYGRCVVSPEADGDGRYYVFFLSGLSSSKATTVYAEPDTLTFLDSEPEHRVLTTIEDFESAPVGTIVKRDTAVRREVAVKNDNGLWARIDTFILRSESLMAEHGPWTVVEWGQE